MTSSNTNIKSINQTIKSLLTTTVILFTTSIVTYLTYNHIKRKQQSRCLEIEEQDTAREAKALIIAHFQSLKENNKHNSVSKNNKHAYVLYTLKQNTKKLKDKLQSLHYLYLKYRISYVKLSPPSSSSSSSTNNNTNTSNKDLKDYVAIPVTLQCYKKYNLYVKNNKNDDNSDWMSFVIDCGIQEVLLRSDIYGNQ